MYKDIHIFNVNNKKFVLDVNSGVLHEIDNIAEDVIRIVADGKDPNEELKNKYDNTEIKEISKEVNELKDKELLFSKDIHKDYVIPYLDKMPIKALCINICMECNFRCKYCFAEDSLELKGKKFMDEKTAFACIDFLIKKSGTRKNLEVDFFGGEPLLNFNVVKKTVEYAKSIEKKYNKNFHFTITTNCSLLDEEKIKFINENMNNVVLSLDGRPEVNNKMRVYVNGKGTYNDIMPNLLKMVKEREKLGKEYFVRGTFTRYNLDFPNDVTHIADHGVHSISLEPVLSSESEDYGITKEMLPRIFKEYERLAKEIIQRKKNGKNDFNFYHFQADLYKGPCVYKRLAGCSAGREYLSVTPDGNIYPCHQLNDNEEFLMGNIYDGKVNSKISEEFSHNHIYSKEECKNCWARFFCSGGCHAGNYKYTGDIKKPYEISCDLQKKRIECALYVSAALKELEQ